MKAMQVREQTVLFFGKYQQLKGHNSRVTEQIWLVIDLARDIMAINIETKFGENWIKAMQVKEQTVLYWSLISN